MLQQYASASCECDQSLSSCTDTVHVAFFFFFYEYNQHNNCTHIALFWLCFQYDCTSQSLGYELLLCASPNGDKILIFYILFTKQTFL